MLSAAPRGSDAAHGFLCAVEPTCPTRSSRTVNPNLLFFYLGASKTLPITNTPVHIICNKS